MGRYWYRANSIGRSRALLCFARSVIGQVVAGCVVQPRPNTAPGNSALEVAAIPGRRLLTGGPIGKPDAAFARRRHLARRNLVLSLGGWHGDAAGCHASAEQANAPGKSLDPLGIVE